MWKIFLIVIRAMFYGCYSRFWLGFPGNAIAIQRQLSLVTLQQQFGAGPFLYRHDSACAHKESSIKTSSHEFGIEELKFSPYLKSIQQSSMYVSLLNPFQCQLYLIYLISQSYVSIIIFWKFLNGWGQ